MEDDDLEYDITFPSPKQITGFSDEDEALLQRKEPVIIILGWLGCTEKYLSKYGQIYDNNGCITIRYTSPGSLTFFNTEQLRGTACKILDLLEDYSITENPILFHVFSNNGSYVYAKIVDVLFEAGSRYKNLNVYGAVIDSAPGKPRFINAAKAYGSSLRANPIVKFVMVLWMTIYLTITGMISEIKAKFNPQIKKTNKHFLFDNMATDPSRWPMLFLYSTMDKVVMSEDIEDMINRRSKLGIRVDAVSWDDTDHVSHLRKHPEKYAQACSDFLNECLQYDQNSDEDSQHEELETEEDYLLSKKQ